MLILGSANLCKAWVVYQTQQKSNRKPFFYCNRHKVKYFPNSFNFPDVIFSRNSKHIKFRFRQTFQEDILADFRFISFLFLSFLLPTQPLNSLTALNCLLRHFKSVKLCLSAYISTSLMSHWQGCDFGEMQHNCECHSVNLFFFFQGLIDKEDMVHIYNGILLSHRKEKIRLLVEMWMNLESVIQSKTSQKEENKYRTSMHACGI